MRAFYIENGALAREDAKHAFRVLRLKPGDEIIALTGGGRFSARITRLDEKIGEVDIISGLPANEPDISVTVYQGLLKSEKMELLAQKLTELGVARFIPVKMRRSVAKFEGERRAERLVKISREAVKQCGRAIPMEISDAMSWDAALQDMRKRELMLIPWEETERGRIRDVFAGRPDARDIGILIGPEGGIERAEIDSAIGENVTLGARILRAETAAIAAAAIVMSLWGDI